MKGWRLYAAIGFTLFALMAIADLIGILPGLGNPEPNAQLFGIPPAQERQRVIVLTILAAGIFISAAMTVYGLFRRAAWSERAGVISGLILIFDGTFQLVTAGTQFTQNKTEVLVTGAVYVVTGLLARWLARLGSRAE